MARGVRNRAGRRSRGKRPVRMLVGRMASWTECPVCDGMLPLADAQRMAEHLTLCRKHAARGNPMQEE